MDKLHSDDPRDADWQKLRPFIDEALGEIDERDRDAILLRFFDGRPFAEIGARLRTTENAARMRVQRALDQLGGALAKRGVTSTSAALALALGPQVGAAAPAGLAATVAGAALTHAAAQSGWVAGFVTLNKIQLAAAGAALLGGAAMLVVQARSNSALRGEVAALRAERQQIVALRAENQQLAERIAQLGSPAPQPVATPGQRAPSAAAAPAAGKLFLGGTDSLHARRMKELDVLAQKSVEVMNRQASRMVDEHKTWLAQANDASLAPDVRAQATAAAGPKLEEIQAKQREIQDYKDAVRAYSKEQTRLSFDGRADAEPPVYVRLAGGTPDEALATFEKIAGAAVVRDPSLANASGAIDVPAWMCAKHEALESLRIALRAQANIVIEPAGGTWIARLGPGK